MALTIVRNDIVNMHVDAIVNATNERLQPGGLGVDAGIHYAAGPQLAEALRAVGSCPTGSAVITPSFALTTCRYIIHAVGPVYRDGAHGERELLQRCYRSILALAREKGCRSVAIPAVSTGACGFPKTEAYRIATACVRDFLLSLPDDEDMMVYYVLYDGESMRVGSKVDAEIPSYISEEYRAQKRRALKAGFLGGSERNAERSARETGALPYGTLAREESVPARPAEAGAALPMACGKEVAPASYAEQDLSFAQMCEWWCARKGISKKTFYIAANINKSMFWNMLHHPEQTPRKTNALACAIGLRLSYDETQDLLMRAGLTLSRYYELDTIVERHIRKRNCDVYEINEELFDHDLPLLGAV